VKKVKITKYNRKPKKIVCEVCGYDKALHWHHIIPRTDADCTDDWKNVAVLCSNCHNRVHDNEIKILGIYNSTKQPYNRFLEFSINGLSNMENKNGK
jgi:5-methylcytosine-specific restriction endonuclease McrA